MMDTTIEICWIYQLLDYLGIQQTSPTNLFCDNQVVRQITSKLIFHERTKHIVIDCHTVRDKHFEGVIKVLLVESKDQLVDIFTKPLPSPSFHNILSKIRLKNIFQSSWYFIHVGRQGVSGSTIIWSGSFEDLQVHSLWVLFYFQVGLVFSFLCVSCFLVWVLSIFFLWVLFPWLPFIDRGVCYC